MIKYNIQMFAEPKNTNLQGKGKGEIINNNLEASVLSNIRNTTKELQPGRSAITMQGGIEYPIMYKEVLAGEYIKTWSIDNLVRIITPLVPTMDKVYITIKAFFVPHTRVWKDAERALAGKTDYEFNDAGPVGSRVNSIPTIQLSPNNTMYSPYRHTLVNRYGVPNQAGNTRINLLLLRGYRAIFNDFIRNKDYEMPKIEWNETSPTAAETNNVRVYQPDGNYISGVTADTAYIVEDAQTRINYLNNIKRDIVNTDVYPGQVEVGDEPSITDHLDWQTAFQDAKQRQENANKNDWDIIAEMGGTKPVLADRVQMLGQVDYELNYQQITQTAPVIDNSSPLGTTGSFSYTKATGTLLQHKHFQQHGFIHIIANINMDPFTEGMTNKELLKRYIDEIYRPGLAKKETQLLMKQEVSNNDTSNSSQSLAFQPAWAEYKRMPSFLSGEMYSKPLETATYDDGYSYVSQAQWHNYIPGDIETINGRYFRDAGKVNRVLARNNIMQTSLASNGRYFINDPILAMSEHKITTSLPIDRSTIEDKDIASKTR